MRSGLRGEARGKRPGTASSGPQPRSSGGTYRCPRAQLKGLSLLWAYLRAAGPLRRRRPLRRPDEPRRDKRPRNRPLRRRGCRGRGRRRHAPRGPARPGRLHAHQIRAAYLITLAWVPLSAAARLGAGAQPGTHRGEGRAEGPPGEALEDPAAGLPRRERLGHVIEPVVVHLGRSSMRDRRAPSNQVDWLRHSLYPPREVSIARIRHTELRSCYGKRITWRGWFPKKPSRSFLGQRPET